MINKLDQFRFSGVHKRRVMLMVSILLLLVILVLISLGALGTISVNDKTNVPSINISPELTGDGTYGVGMNMDSIPEHSRLDNTSFESSITPRSYHISSVSSDFITYDRPEMSLIGDEIASGDKVSCLSIDNEGFMATRYEGEVLSYWNYRLSHISMISDESGTLFEDTIIDTSFFSGNLCAVTANGLLLSDILAPEISSFLSLEYKFVDITTTESRIYALTSEGVIYASSDGRNFTLFSDLLRNVIPQDQTATYIAASGGNLNVLTSSGAVYFVTTEQISYSRDALFLVDNGTTSFLIELNGDVYQSTNQISYSLLYSLPVFNPRNIVDICSDDNRLYILTTDKVLIIGDGGCLEVPIMEEASSVVSYEEESFIILSSEGTPILYSSLEDYSGKALSSDYISCDNIFSISNGKILSRIGNSYYLDEILNGIQVEPSIIEEEVNPGEILMITSTNRSVDSWEVIGEGTRLMSSSLYSYSGESSGRIEGVGEGLHAIYQPLEGVASDNFSSSKFYRMELSLRQEHISGPVMVFLRGNSGDFDDEGFIIDNVGDKFSSYSYTFALPASEIDSLEQLSFYIAFEGNGILYVDDVYLGEDGASIGQIPSLFSSLLSRAKPSSIRVDSIRIGNDSFSEENFYGVRTSSIESMLKLNSELNSNPWLIIDSYSTPAMIDNLMSYLSGSVSSEYGKRRIDNGTAMPWSRQFDTIYIEILDSSNVFSSDTEKGAFVSYVMSLISHSEGYVDLRGKLVFLDGMSYEEGFMLSDADYSTSVMDINLSLISDEMSFQDLISKSYQDLAYMSPRVPTYSNDSGEFISSLRLVGGLSELNTAEMISLFINDNASFVRMTMVYLPLSIRKVDYESNKMLCPLTVALEESERKEYGESVLSSLEAIGIASSIDNSEYYYSFVRAPIDYTVSEYVPLEDSCSYIYVKGENGSYIVVANYSDTTRNFLLNSTSGSLRGSTVHRYSYESVSIYSRELWSTSIRQTLQAGEVLVLELPE